jgi:hypothetical protein
MRLDQSHGIKKYLPDKFLRPIRGCMRPPSPQRARGRCKPGALQIPKGALLPPLRKHPSSQNTPEPGYSARAAPPRPPLVNPPRRKPTITHHSEGKLRRARPGAHRCSSLPRFAIITAQEKELNGDAPPTREVIAPAVHRR